MPLRPNRPVYLDNQATTPCDPRVLQAMLPWFCEQFGNPHSVEHVMGRQAEAAVEQARAQVAALIGAGGFGALMFQGLLGSALDLVLLGVLPVVALAIAVDALFKLLIAGLSRHD